MYILRFLCTFCSAEILQRPILAGTQVRGRVLCLSHSHERWACTVSIEMILQGSNLPCQQRVVLSQLRYLLFVGPIRAEEVRLVIRKRWLYWLWLVLVRVQACSVDAVCEEAIHPFYNANIFL